MASEKYGEAVGKVKKALDEDNLEATVASLTSPSSGGPLLENHDLGFISPNLENHDLVQVVNELKFQQAKWQEDLKCLVLENQGRHDEALKTLTHLLEAKIDSSNSQAFTAAKMAIDQAVDKIEGLKGTGSQNVSKTTTGSSLAPISHKYSDRAGVTSISSNRSDKGPHKRSDSMRKAKSAACFDSLEKAATTSNGMDKTISWKDDRTVREDKTMKEVEEVQQPPGAVYTAQDSSLFQSSVASQLIASPSLAGAFSFSTEGYNSSHNRFKADFEGTDKPSKCANGEARDGQRLQKALTRAGVSLYRMSLAGDLAVIPDSDENRAPAFLVTLVYSKWFDFAVTWVIALNTVMIGAQTDYSARNLGAEDPSWFGILEFIFCAIFLMELLMRVIVEQETFISGANKKWNLFDSVVVIFSLVDIWAESSNSGLRVLRVIRIFRIFRVMRFLQDLRRMISGIIGTLMSLFWAMILLIMVMFLFGVIMTQNVTEVRLNMNESADGEESDLSELDESYGSLGLTLYSLFKAISGGEDWGDLSDPLMNVSWVFGLLFTIYVSFAVFCVLNIVTAVFVERANTICQDEDAKQHRKLLMELRTVFLIADVDGNGELDYHEFSECLEDEIVQGYLRKLDLDVESIGHRCLFDLLDFGGAGYVNVDTFIRGVVRLKGKAKSFDMYRVHSELSRLHDKMTEQQDRMNMLTGICVETEMKVLSWAPAANGKVAVPLHRPGQSTAQSPVRPGTSGNRLQPKSVTSTRPPTQAGSAGALFEVPNIRDSTNSDGCGSLGIQRPRSATTHRENQSPSMVEDGINVGLPATSSNERSHSKSTELA